MTFCFVLFWVFLVFSEMRKAFTYRGTSTRDLEKWYCLLRSFGLSVPEGSLTLESAFGIELFGSVWRLSPTGEIQP